MKTLLTFGLASSALALSILASAGTLNARPFVRAEPESVKVPDTAPGRCARAFVGMVNKADADSVIAFESEFASTKRRAAVSAEERARRIKSLHEEWGDATIKRVADANESGITLHISTSRRGVLELQFKFDPAESGKLEGVIIQNAQEIVPLTSELRSTTVEAAAKALEEAYVYPDIARKMGSAVRAKLKAGEYDSIGDEASLARRLTDDLQAVSQDKHLRVVPSPTRTTESHDGMPSRDEMRVHNYAFRKTEILDGNIGYLRFDLFVEDDEAKKTATAALGFLSHCDAMIIDLRYNGGGSPEMIRYITSYFFDQPTHLNSMIDREGKVVEEYWTLKDIPGLRFRADLPIFVLTSSRTFSGAEEFSYNLKNLKRATIIGETTGGGAHPVRGERLNDRFMVRVPFMRAYNPISKTNWEGTGVEPDIKVSADEALDRAIQAAKK